LTSAEGEPPSESASSDAGGVCPDCGAVVETSQEYCLVCGARLNEAGGAGLAERWRHALPFTDKDWGWPVLIALTIAVLASVFSILAVQSDKPTMLQALGPSVKQTTAAVTTGTSQTTGNEATNNSSTSSKRRRRSRPALLKRRATRRRTTRAPQQRRRLILAPPARRPRRRFAPAAA